MRSLILNVAGAYLLAFSSAPAAASGGPPVKMSKNGICHPRGGTYFAQTKNYTPFKSMAECVRAGGRPPKR